MTCGKDKLIYLIGKLDTDTATGSAEYCDMRVFVGLDHRLLYSGIIYKFKN